MILHLFGCATVFRYIYSMQNINIPIIVQLFNAYIIQQSTSTNKINKKINNHNTQLLKLDNKKRIAKNTLRKLIKHHHKVMPKDFQSRNENLLALLIGGHRYYSINK